MPEFHIEHVTLEYLINHRCGCGQRSNITLYDASGGPKPIAARAQPHGQGGLIVSLKNCQIQFV